MSRTLKSILGTAHCISAVALVSLRLVSADAQPMVAHAVQATRVVAPPARIQLDMATLHAAVLSKPRTARDSMDAPYLLVALTGPGARQTSLQMPAAGKHWSIRPDEAKGLTPLTSLVIEPGDSVRLLFTLLEAEPVNAAAEQSVSAALAKLSSASMTSAVTIASTLSPLTTQGANWIGSGSMLLTNEGGKAYWRALDCVAMCKVSNTPVKAGSDGELAPDATNAVAAVLEFSGNAATYHLQVTAKRGM